MSEYIVISRESIADYISHAYYQGWNAGSTARLSDGEEVPLVDQRSCDFQQSKAIRIAWDLPTGWRPIAEAPKDGTWVLVASHSKGEYPEWLYEQCVWVAEQQDWYGSTDWRAVGKPTHFLPLIEPTEK